MSRSLLIQASTQTVWRTLAEFADISAWAPTVSHSSAASDSREGIGAVRRVQVGRLALLERVTEWVPGERLGYRIDGLPPLAGDVFTTWRLEAQQDATLATVSTSVEPVPRPPGPIVGRVMARRLAAAAGEMLAGLREHIERTQEQT